MVDWMAGSSFQEVFEQNGSVMLLVDPVGGKIVDANPAALAYYGYPPEQLVGTSLTEINSLSWEETAIERKNALFPERNSFSFRHRLFSGESRDVEVFFSPANIAGKQLLFSVVHDVTALKQAHEELLASAALHRAIFQSSLNALAITRESDGMFVDVNGGFLEMVGFQREEVIGRTVSEINLWVSSDDRENYVEAAQQNSVSRDREIKLRRKDGEVFWAIASVCEIDIEGHPHLFSVLKNVSDVKAAKEQITSLVYYDPLTQLPNQRLLLERLRAALDDSSKSRKRILLVVDLDKFREVKDTFGYEAGELMLMEVARRLTSCARETDTVARLGGNEFAVLLDNLKGHRDNVAAQAKTMAEKIKTALSQPYMLAGHEYHGVSSIGIFVIPNQLKSAGQAIQRAEIALSYAKTASSNKIRFFSPDLQAVVQEHAAIKEDLCSAIKSGQLALFYQPQISSGNFVGAEALVRWHHPTRGLLNPIHFVPLAEETGLILPLGNWILDAAFRQIARWGQSMDTDHIRISVNVTAQEFQQPNFVEEVLAALRRSGAN
jgi:diguanylate cyclase (GGDEF)-like protein/PAS domain S-box-containing protein